MTEEQEEPTEGLPERPAPSPIVESLLASPDIQRAIAEIPQLMRAHSEAKLAAIRWTTRSALIWAAFLIFGIIVPVTVLAWFGKLSSDAAAFLFGAIIGATFTFVRSFLASRE